MRWYRWYRQLDKETRRSIDIKAVTRGVSRGLACFEFISESSTLWRTVNVPEDWKLWFSGVRKVKERE